MDQKSPLKIVAILEVRIEAMDLFHQFERHAASIMEKHGGRIEHAITIPPKPGAKSLKEIHVVSFPDEDAFQAYRQDPAVAKKSHWREQAVVSTKIFIGQDGPNYHLSG